MCSKLKRRSFVNKTALTSLIGLMHPACLMTSSNKDSKPSATTPPAHNTPFLIKNIRLQTQVDLAEMKTFYHDQIGLPILKNDDTEITFLAGVSSITFVKTAGNTEAPFYHFAFNIPENKIMAARAWQAERCSLITTPVRLRDPAFPNDIRHFRNWNAHSVFFFDPAENIVEYIARHDLRNARAGDFTTQDILNISEIAFVVDDQESMAKIIHENCGLPVYPQDSSFWWSMGDEHGLLLAIRKRRWGNDTETPKDFSIFKTEVTIVSEQEKKIQLPDYPYQVQMIT